MNTRLHILMVANSDDEAIRLAQVIRRGGYEPAYERVSTTEAMATALNHPAWDAIILDYGLVRLDAAGTLAQAKARQPDVPIVVLADSVDAGEAIALLRAGAHDCVMRDRLARLAPTIEREVTARQERERLAEALRRSESEYRMLMEQASDAISIANSQGHYVEVNSAACQMLGYPRDELLRMNVTDLIHPADLAQTPVHFGALRDGQTVLSERRLRRKDGTLIFAETSARMLADGLILAITRDITERKQHEEQLRRYSAELAQSNEELKRFAYIVSHDLRAPLVNLKGFAAELRSALQTIIQPALDAALPQMGQKQRSAVTDALQKDVPEALDFIDTSVTRMDHFINALLKLSRLGRSEIMLEPLNMDALVQETLATLAHRIEQRQVKVTVGPLPEVIADRTSMEQIMSNILNNAIIYLDPNRPGEIEITGERSPEAAMFHVRDNGRGIAPGDMDKVFAPFRRAGQQDVPGEGMGLAYVQTLVRRHDGYIWCESEPGAGTTFTFTISSHLAKGN